MLVVYKLNMQEARNIVTHKLLLRFSAPWRVIKQYDNTVTYEIRHPEHGETKVINRDRLAVYIPNRSKYNLYDIQQIPRPWPLNPNRQIQQNTTVHEPEQQDETEQKEEDTDKKEEKEKEEQSKKDEEVPPQGRSLRKTIERQSRAGDPMHWQYSSTGALTL